MNDFFFCSNLFKLKHFCKIVSDDKKIRVYHWKSLSRKYKPLQKNYCFFKGSVFFAAYLMVTWTHRYKARFYDKGC